MTISTPTKIKNNGASGGQELPSINCKMWLNLLGVEVVMRLVCDAFLALFLQRRDLVLKGIFAIRTSQCTFRVQSLEFNRLPSEGCRE